MAAEVAPSSISSLLKEADKLLHAPLQQYDPVMMDTAFAGLQDAHMDDADQSRAVAADVREVIDDTIATRIASAPAPAPKVSSTWIVCNMRERSARRRSATSLPTMMKFSSWALSAYKFHTKKPRRA